MVSYIPSIAPRARRGRLIRFLLWSTILFGPALYFGAEGDYVVAAVCAIASIGALSGYRAGAAFILASFAAAATAFSLAPSLGLDYEVQFSEFFGTTGLVNRFMSICAMGLLVTCAVTGALLIIVGIVLRGRPGLERANQCFGFGIGAVQGPAAVLFLLGGFLVIEGMEQHRADDERRPIVTNLVLKTTEMTRKSRLGPTVVAYNPFTQIPQLNKLEDVQRSVQVLSDPVQLRGLLNHPSIRELQRRPEVRSAVEKLAEDPAIQEILGSDKRMDRSTAMLLLKHPAVLELLDQPGFLEEASQIINGPRSVLQ